MVLIEFGFSSDYFSLSASCTKGLFHTYSSMATWVSSLESKSTTIWSAAISMFLFLLLEWVTQTTEEINGDFFDLLVWTSPTFSLVTPTISTITLEEEVGIEVGICVAAWSGPTINSLGVMIGSFLNLWSLNHFFVLLITLKESSCIISSSLQSQSISGTGYPWTLTLNSGSNTSSPSSSWISATFINNLL